MKMTRRPYGRDRLLPRNPKPKPRYEKSEVAARAAWPHAAPTAFPPSRLPTGRPVSAHVVSPHQPAMKAGCTKTSEAPAEAEAAEAVAVAGRSAELIVPRSRLERNSTAGVGMYDSMSDGSAPTETSRP